MRIACAVVSVCVRIAQLYSSGFDCGTASNSATAECMASNSTLVDSDSLTATESGILQQLKRSTPVHSEGWSCGISDNNATTMPRYAPVTYRLQYEVKASSTVCVYLLLPIHTYPYLFIPFTAYPLASHLHT